MSLNLHHSTSQSVLIARTVPVGFLPYWWGIAIHFDPFSYPLWDGNFYHNYLRLPEIPIGKAFGMHFNDDGRHYKVSNPPSQFVLPHDYDTISYGSEFIQGLQIAAQTFSGGRSRLEIPSSEKFVRHINYVGDLISGAHSALPAKSLFTSSKFGWAYNARYFAPAYNSAEVVSLNPNYVNGVRIGNIESHRDFNDIVDAAKIQCVSEPTAHPSYFGGLNRAIVSATSVNLTISEFGGFTFRYHVNVDVQPSWYLVAHTYDWDIEIQFSDLTFPNTRDYLVGDIVEFPYDAVNTYDVSLKNFSASPEAPQQAFDDTTVQLEYHSTVYILTTPSLPSNASVPVMKYKNDLYTFKNQLPLKNFESLVNSNWYDIIPASCFSTAAAISDLTGNFDNDLLQTVAKIPQISSALPDIKAALEILGALYKRDFSFSSIRKILNFLTSTYIQASFTWRPYYELLFKYLPMMVSDLPNFDSRQLTVGRGSFRRVISPFLNRESVTLTVRTKIVADLSLNGIMAAYLSLDNYGLMPRVSRALDLVPFSFVANWYTGAVKAIYIMEQLSTMLVIPSYCVHTYSLVSPFSDAELELYQVSNTSASDTTTGIKIFYRDISRYIPIPRNSFFRFGVPPNYPPSGLVGSLIYQLLFSG